MSGEYKEEIVGQSDPHRYQRQRFILDLPARQAERVAGEGIPHDVADGRGGDHFVRLFLLCPLLTYDDPLEAYDMLVKEERVSTDQPSPGGLAAAAVVAH